MIFFDPYDNQSCKKKNSDFLEAGTIGLIRVGINTTSHIMQYCVTWHFSQQCMAERASWLSFYYHFWRHPAKQLISMASLLPLHSFLSIPVIVYTLECVHTAKSLVFYIIGESNYSFFLIYGQGHKILCSK